MGIFIVVMIMVLNLVFQNVVLQGQQIQAANDDDGNYKAVLSAYSDPSTTEIYNISLGVLPESLKHKIIAVVISLKERGCVASVPMNIYMYIYIYGYVKQRHTFIGIGNLRFVWLS